MRVAMASPETLRYIVCHIGRSAAVPRLLSETVLSPVRTGA